MRDRDSHSALTAQSAQMREVIEGQRKELKEKESRITRLEELIQQREAELNHIYRSHGWKALTVYYRVRNKILPETTKRRELAKYLLRLLGKTYGFLRAGKRGATDISVGDAIQSEGEAYTHVKAPTLEDDRPSLAHRSGKRLSDWAGFLTKRFEGIPHAWGYLEEIVHSDGVWHLKGWMLLPKKQFTSIGVYFNEKLIGHAEPEFRQDLANVFSDVLHAGSSGFRFCADKVKIESAEMGRVDLIGCQNGQPMARMSSLYWKGLEGASVPSPPPELMRRVLGTRDARVFKNAGLKSFGEFLDAILRHYSIASVRRFLDWGCGCGRVCVHFLFASDGPEVFGCDVDAEAIAWCNENLQPGHFSQIQPWPPTSYWDAMFDLVIGFSVFTHLSREAQAAWLAEMRRIIAPGGLFLASTHGESAALPVPSVSAEMLRVGISDRSPDPVLNGIAPKGYYRSTFQTRDYTLREWSKYFEILEYIERQCSNHQDLVVMRRPR